MTTVITSINQKGGVGKTTLTMLTSDLMHGALGPRTLLIDLDPLGTLSDLMLSRYGATAQRTVTDWLRGSSSLEEARTFLCGGTYLLAADNGLEDVLTDIAADPAKVFNLRDMISQQCGAFDLILIDAPPSVSSLAWAAIIAADMIIVPTLADMTSVKGLGNIMRQIEDLRANVGTAPTLIGVVANMVDRTLKAQTALQALQAPDMPPLLGTLPKRSGRDAWTELKRAYKPIAQVLFDALQVPA